MRVVESLVRTAAPTVPAISLADAKAHLRVQHSEEDALITALVKAVEADFERQTNRALMRGTYLFTTSQFAPDSAGLISINKCPLHEVSQIIYFDANGQQQTLGTSVYRVNALAEPWHIELKQGQSWPATDARTDAVQVTFTAGYAAAADVPADYIAAMKLLLGHLYENREAVSPTQMNEVPMGYRSIVNMAAVNRFR